MNGICRSLGFGFIALALSPVAPAWTQTLQPRAVQAFDLAVNTLQDGPITPDGVLTLREAIEVANGTLSLDALSVAERSQVQVLALHQPSRIHWALANPVNNPVVELTNPLPPLAQQHLSLDGAVGNRLVLLTPAAQTSVARGLTIVADGVTVKNFRFAGFTTHNPQFNAGEYRTADIHDRPQTRPSTLTGDIVITTGQILQDLHELSGITQSTPPQGVEITANHFGDQNPDRPSAFGVVIFEGADTQIHDNTFQFLQGSAILTGKEATTSHIRRNEILNSGGAGMADAIHLEGSIGGTAIDSNVICHNAGSAIFLFKPQGSIQIRDNEIHYNGEKSDRAAIYLMGSGHEVTGNHITHQSGSGVVVAAYPRSVQNRIQSNHFAALQGLSIDLVDRRSTGVWDYALGDGVNPSRVSENRRLDTANEAINAPQFAGDEFFMFGDAVEVSGQADAGAIVEIYKVAPPQDSTKDETLKDRKGRDFRQYAPLDELLVSLPADPKTGHFEIRLTGLKVGDRLSATATDSAFGTSEPAKNAVIRTIADSGSQFPTPSHPQIPCQ